MAESSTGDKSEKPSEQKLRKAREQGQVARSKDIGTAVGLLLGLKLLIWLTPGYLEDFSQLFRLVVAPLQGDDALAALDALWAEAADQSLWLLVRMVLPLIVLPLAIVVSGQLAGGLMFSTQLWAPQFSRLNPISNLGRLFSGKHYSEFGITLMKVAGVLAVLIWITRGLAADFVRLQGMSLSMALTQAGGLVMDAVFSMVAVLAAYALVDAPLQRIFFMRGQRMTKQEVKDEYKQNEGKPEVRQRIRQLQQQLARRSVRKAVPQADVVIVNPQHYAVALRYDNERAEAPYVIAKGVDEMALYIRQLAREFEVQVLELPPLARAIYNSSQVQQQIPASLYQSVAQVLSYVMQLKAFRSGQRKTEPRLASDLGVPRHLSDPDSSDGGPAAAMTE